MGKENPELDRLQGAYKAAIEEWIAVFGRKKPLLRPIIQSHKLTAGSRRIFERKMRAIRPRRRKAGYEAGLRAKFFGF
jgi:hypothetical protein